MKKFVAIITLLFILAAFVFYIQNLNRKNTVIGIINPTKIIVDLNNNGIADNNEVICIEGVESFSLIPNENFNKKYEKQLNLTHKDFINLGYLAEEFSKNALLEKNISIDFTKKTSSACRYAKIKINNIDYAKLLYYSGFGFINGKLGNTDKYKKHLEASKKLNLVILNHHSNKYHTLDCEYGHLAHDSIVIPIRSLPQGAIPCKVCHNKIKKPRAKHKKNNSPIFTTHNIPSPPLITHGGNITLYFFDYTKHLKPDEKCETEICKTFLEHINSSQESIDIAIYGYDEIPKITEALENARNRGVEIRYVYDEDPVPELNFYKNNDIIKKIASAYSNDKLNSESHRIMHNKFFIFDKKTVITGSMNFSQSGLSNYDVNDVAIINSKEVAELYTQEFEQMITGHFHNAKIKNSAPNKFVIDNSLVEVYFSPKSPATKRILELINNAKNYIYAPTFLITHNDITNALIKAKKRGVDVKIIMDANNINTKHTKYQILRGNAIALKSENYAGKLHSKTMIIDDEYVVMGSMNFSQSGTNGNDENTLIIQNSEFAANYKNFFNYLWAVIPDKYLKFNPSAESKESIGSCYDGVDNNFDGKIDSQDPKCK